MYRLQNYTDIFRQLNITDEDIDYVNSFGFDNLTGHSGDRFEGRVRSQVPRGGSSNGAESDRTIQPASCYCDGAIRDLAMQYKNYHGYASLIVCSFGTFTNMLNIIVLTRKDTKSAPINRILTGLAMADVLVMLEYIPFAIYKYLVLPECRIFPYGWAVFVLFHMHFTQLFHTISIALTLTLAVWRYIAIRFPWYNHTWCTRRRCTIALSCSFLAPFLACAPSYFVFGIKAQTVYENGTKEILYHVDTNYSIDKGFLYQLNFLILGIVVKLLPCVLLTIIICWLIKALYRAEGRKQTLKSYNHCSIKMDKPQPTSSSRISDLENHDGSLNNKKIERPRRASKSDKRADRTTRMLVVVLLLFLVTEIPQGIFGLLSAALGDCFFRNCYQKFGELMDILALLNGSINFILYCSMSRQFRIIFGQLFKPKIMNWPLTNHHQTDIQSTYV